MSDHQLLQRQWTAWVRDPENQTPPAGDPQRLAIYRDLFFNNVRGFLDATFPVSAAMLGESSWIALCRHFFASHRCHSPYFLDIPAEFLDWLAAQPQAEHPWLPELAHYEWLELALDIDPADVVAQPVEAIVAGLQQKYWEQARVSLSPVAQGRWYQFAVHRIRPLEDAPQPSPCGLIVFRNAQDSVGFIEVSALSLLLFQCLQQEETQPLREVLQRVFQAGGIPVTEAAITGALQVLQQWAEAGLVTGVN